MPTCKKEKSFSLSYSTGPARLPFHPAALAQLHGLARPYALSPWPVKAVGPCGNEAQQALLSLAHLAQPRAPLLGPVGHPNMPRLEALERERTRPQGATTTSLPRRLYRRPAIHAACPVVDTDVEDRRHPSNPSIACYKTHSCRSAPLRSPTYRRHS
jgi:hypothetical protein